MPDYGFGRCDGRDKIVDCDSAVPPQPGDGVCRPDVAFTNGLLAPGGPPRSTPEFYPPVAFRCAPAARKSASDDRFTAGARLRWYLSRRSQDFLRNPFSMSGNIPDTPSI